MKINLKYKNKKIEIEVQKCNLFGMVRGLMFRRGENAPALLLFDFKKLRRLKIHSFFCPEFLAVWLDGKNNVFEIKKVYPWKIAVFPKKSFVKLIEIPCSSKYRDIIKFLVDDAKPKKF